MPGSRRAPSPRRSRPRVEYTTLAELRYRLRVFLRVREIAARAVGVEPQQYLLLLQVKGMEGRRPATIGALAERLQITPHAVVQLVDRLQRTGMVARRPHGTDRRTVAVVLQAAGEKVLERLARQSVTELRTEGPLLVSSLRRLVSRPARGAWSPRRGRRKETS